MRHGREEIYLCHPASIDTWQIHDLSSALIPPAGLVSTNKHNQQVYVERKPTYDNYSRNTKLQKVHIS